MEEIKSWSLAFGLIVGIIGVLVTSGIGRWKATAHAENLEPIAPAASATSSSLTVSIASVIDSNNFRNIGKSNELPHFNIVLRQHFQQASQVVGGGL